MNQRKLLCLISLGVLSCSSLNVFSEDLFQSEVTVGTVLNDDRNGVERTTITGNFRWYADSVSTDLGPWSALGFLSKTSFYDAGYAYLDSELDNNFFRSSSENHSFSLGGRRFLSENTFVNFGYSHNRFQNEIEGIRREFNDSSNSYNIGVGTYLTDTSTLSFDAFDSENRKPVYTLSYNNILLVPKDDVSHGFNASVSYDSDDVFADWKGSIGYSLYPSRDLSFSVNASIAYDEDFPSAINEMVSAGVSAEYFFSPLQSLSVNTSFSINTPDDFIESSETIGVTYQHRF